MTMRTVTGRWLLGDGTPAVGFIHLTPDVRIAAADYITVSNTVAVPIDTDGRISIGLRAGDGWLWEVVEHLGGDPVRWRFELPAGPPLDLADVAADRVSPICRLHHTIAAP